MEVDFKIEGSIKRYDDGAVFIELVPTQEDVTLSDQQILDSVVELLLWHGGIEITNEPDPGSLDS